MFVNQHIMLYCVSLPSVKKLWLNIAIEYYFSKIQLVVYYQCCVMIGWATTRLLCYSQLVAKFTGFENQNNSGWIAFCWLKLFCPDIFDKLVGFYLNNYSSHPSRSESVAHEAIRALGIIIIPQANYNHWYYHFNYHYLFFLPAGWKTSHWCKLLLLLFFFFFLQM